MIFGPPLTVEFFQDNRTGSISVILLTNGQTEGRTNGRAEGQINSREFNISLAELTMTFCKIA